MKWRWRNSGFCTTCSNRRYSPVSIYKWTRVSFLCWTMRNIRRKRGMSGAYATASQGGRHVPLWPWQPFGHGSPWTAGMLPWHCAMWRLCSLRTVLSGWKESTLVGCWAHARKIRGCPEENRTLATQAIHYIGKLYKIESDANDAGLTLKSVRKNVSMRPIRWYLNLKSGCRMLYLRVLPKSRMGKAIEYTLHAPSKTFQIRKRRKNRNWWQTCIENAIRPLALGRKNYLFCGNDASAYWGLPSCTHWLPPANQRFCFQT